MRKLYWCGMLVGMFWLLPSYAQVEGVRAEAQFHTTMEAALREEALVGAVWATVTPDGVVWGAVGLADASRGELLSAESRVQTGSIAKTLIATGVLRLVTEGRLALDTPVAKLLPDQALENPWASTHPVLIRHLLDHTSGLDDARLWQVFSLNAGSATPLSASLGTGSLRLRVRSRPGSRLSYSNMGYTLLGMVIERVTGERYEQYLDSHLLRPLGMHASTFAFVSQTGSHADARLAMGHFENGVTQPAVPLYLRPAGQFATTASDMALFARFLMSDGGIDGKPFVAPHLLRAMGTPSTTEAALAGLEMGYAIGLNSRDRHGVIGLCHVGTTIGFRANLCLFPDEQKAFFVAMNADVETADYERFDALLIRELAVRGANPAAGTVPPAAIGDWQGIYVLAPSRTESFAYLDRVLNFATVRWDGSQLHLRPFQGAARSLTPTKGWLFRAQDRTHASHVLLMSADGRRTISDGFRSYEQTSPWRILPLWMSLAAGVIGLVYLALRGIFRTVQWRLNPRDPLFAPFLATVALLLPIPLFFSQSFLQLGDLTAAGALLTLVTGILPMAMLFGLLRSVARGTANRSALLDALAMTAVLQWTIVLAVWGLVPLRLWV